MTRDEAVAHIKQLLGFRSDKDAEIILALKFQQAEAESDAILPHFLREEAFFSNVVLDGELLSPPADFIREWDDDALYIKFVDPVSLNERWEPLWKDTTKYLRTSINNTIDPTDPDEIVTRPRGYSFDGVNFRLFPTPLQVYDFKMIYYAKDAVLDTNIENKWLKEMPYYLIGKAGIPMAASLRDKDALQIFGGYAASGAKKLSDVSTDRDMMGKKLVIGGGD